MGGEKDRKPTWNVCAVGSPPRGRGKGADLGVGDQRTGITPAWAGKSLFCFTAAVPIQDHPRIGGEKFLTGLFLCSQLGLPPHGRGKVAVNQCFDQALRITPALAGKSTESLQFWIASEDHPRVGGEKVRSRPTCVALKGSPPRARGKDHSDCAEELRLRITPA